MTRILLPGELAKNGSLSGFARKGGTSVRSLGADAGEIGFKWSDAAQKLANAALAQAPTAVYVLVSFAAGGASPQVLPFSDKAAGAQAYSDLIETTPTDRVYAAGFCVDAPVAGHTYATASQCDEWFGAVTRTFSSYFSKYNVKKYAPWILGAGAVVIAAMYFGKKQPKRAGRRRRASSWRRRTTTVWR